MKAKRILQRILARKPNFYKALLRLTARGSVEKQLYLSLIKPDMVVLDIGANRGYFTTLFSDLVGKQGKVHAFEPVSLTFEILREQVRSAGCQNIILNQIALGEMTTRTTMFLPGNDGGQAALVKHHIGSWQDGKIMEYPVRLVRLDDYALKLLRIDFIKCDVEGAELLVLKGGLVTIRRCRPILFLESDNDWMADFGWDSSVVLQLLREIGYQYFYSVGKRITKLRNVPVDALLCGFEQIDGLA